MQYGLPGSIDSMRRAFLRPVVLGRGEKLPHGWCCGGVSGKLGYAQALEPQAKNALRYRSSAAAGQGGNAADQREQSKPGGGQNA